MIGTKDKGWKPIAERIGDGDPRLQKHGRAMVHVLETILINGCTLPPGSRGHFFSQQAKNALLRAGLLDYWVGGAGDE